MAEKCSTPIENERNIILGVIDRSSESLDADPVLRTFQPTRHSLRRIDGAKALQNNCGFVSCGGFFGQFCL